MDVLRTIETKGYRQEDLNEKHRDILTWLRYLQEDFIECFEYENPCEYGIIGDIKDEIAGAVIEQVKDWMAIQIAEYQINFAEMEAEDKIEGRSE